MSKNCTWCEEEGMEETAVARCFAGVRSEPVHECFECMKMCVAEDPWNNHRPV